MQIDKLQIELRPRSNAQALDLGFAVLRAHAGPVYRSFLALWLPLMALCALLTVLLPDWDWVFMLCAWWIKPLLERAPLFVLSRAVFGTSVHWREALRAWPGQLGGGWLRLLTWGRLISAGRGLHHPVWQLEQARGAVATTRRRILGRQGTFAAAFWFGVVCLGLDLVLQVGMMTFLSLFIEQPGLSNPIAIVSMLLGNTSEVPIALMMLGLFAISTAILTPVYIACCFTLYLNRRASLEAWDLELQLRQIAPPAAARGRGPGTAVLLAVLALALTLGTPPPLHAAGPVAAAADPNAAKCVRPDENHAKVLRGPVQDARQARIRQQVDALYVDGLLSAYRCEQAWRPKDLSKDKKRPKIDAPDFSSLASILRVLVIAALVGAVGYLLYRYRERLPRLGRRGPAMRATEVGGLDIRAASLPDDVAATVRALWQQGQRRAALALLYRATLSRLVSDDGLTLTQGDTEGDCLRAARAAAQQQRLDPARLDSASAVTGLWLDGAYAGRWPDGAAVLEQCRLWDQRFGLAGRSA